MIEPAGTSWPSPAFTPSRWPTLSRPFLTLPPAFLCAIGSYSSFLVARFGALFFGAALASAASAAFALAVVFFGAALASALAAVFVSAFGRRPWRRSPSASALALDALAVDFFVGSLVACGELRGELGVRGGLGRGGLLEALALGLGVLLGLGGRLRGALAVEPDVADAEDRQLLAMALLDAAARLGAVLERR